MGWFDPARAWRWRRPADVLAVRFQLKKGGEPFKNGLVVEEGTRGLLLYNGRIDAEIDPGRHEFEEVRERFRNIDRHPELDVLLIPETEFQIGFETAELRTRDEVPLRAVCAATLRIENGGAFFIRFLGRCTNR